MLCNSKLLHFTSNRSASSLFLRNVKGSEQYQLLKRPVSIEHFSAGVEPTSLAFTVGLQCLTHRHTVIEVKRDVTIKVKATRQPLESVNVTLVERNSQGGSKDRCREFVLAWGREKGGGNLNQ